MEKILEINNLKKYYKENKAVDGLSFDVYEGEILGLLGPNGAGKSTTISILSTILKKDSGEIQYFGKELQGNLKYIKSNLGVVPQDLAIYEDISSYKNVEFFASLYGVKKENRKEAVMQALKFVGLEDRAKEKPKTFSGGMKRRLNIACAIAHKPKILILDEPTVGIDPQSRNHILDSIKTLNKNGTTVIYTTHYMEEVEEIADRIIIMDKGKKITQGTLEELLQKYKNTRIYDIYIQEKIGDAKYLQEIEGIEQINVKDNQIEIQTNKQIENFNTIILKLIENGAKIGHITTQEGNLEMVFLELTGRTLRD